MAHSLLANWLSGNWPRATRWRPKQDNNNCQGRRTEVSAEHSMWRLHKHTQIPLLRFNELKILDLFWNFNSIREKGKIFIFLKRGHGFLKTGKFCSTSLLEQKMDWNSCFIHSFIYSFLQEVGTLFLLQAKHSPRPGIIKIRASPQPQGGHNLTGRASMRANNYHLAGFWDVGALGRGWRDLSGLAWDRKP